MLRLISGQSGIVVNVLMFTQHTARITRSSSGCIPDSRCG